MSKQGGYTVIGLIFVVVLILAIWQFMNRRVEILDTTNTTTSEVVETEEIEEAEPVDEQSITLNPLVEVEFPATALRQYTTNDYKVIVSLGTQELSDGAFYRAYLEGPGETINIGKLTKEGTTLKVTYESSRDLRNFKTIRISVVGSDFAIIEGKQIETPFDIFSGQFD